MRSTVVLSLIGLLLTALPLARSMRTGDRMVDPVFGIVYDPKVVHFEKAPPSFERVCAKELRGRRNFWLYAYWKEGNTEYLILSNLESQETGGGAVIDGDRCKLSVPDWILAGDPKKVDPSVKFSEAVLRSLSRDLLRRYAVAFGGKRSFLDALRRLRYPYPDEQFAVLRGEFEKFVKEP